MPAWPIPSGGPCGCDVTKSPEKGGNDTTDEAKRESAPRGKDAYYIEDGVHRAIAARENRLKIIPAVLYEPGQPPQAVYVPLDQLHSPKPSISRSDPRHHYPALEAAMGTPLGRSKIPPISIQPLGAPGQTQSIPLDQVSINP
jgi:hypothetical protein